MNEPCNLEHLFLSAKIFIYKLPDKISEFPKSPTVQAWRILTI